MGDQYPAPTCWTAQSDETPSETALLPFEIPYIINPFSKGFIPVGFQIYLQEHRCLPVKFAGLMGGRSRVPLERSDCGSSGTLSIML